MPRLRDERQQTGNPLGTVSCTSPWSMPFPFPTPLGCVISSAVSIRWQRQFGDKTLVARSQGPVGEMPSVAVCSANTTPPAPESRAVSCNDVAVHAAGTVKPR